MKWDYFSYFIPFKWGFSFNIPENIELEWMKQLEFYEKLTFPILFIFHYKKRTATVKCFKMIFRGNSWISSDATDT